MLSTRPATAVIVSSETGSSGVRYIPPSGMALSELIDSTGVSPTDYQAILLPAEGRRLTKNALKKLKRRRKKDLEHEANRQSTEVTSQAVEVATQVKTVAGNETEKMRQHAAAVFIQTLWRTPAVRGRCVQALARKMGESRRRSWAAGIIVTTWKCYKVRKTTSAKSTRKEKMPQHCHSRKELILAVDLAEIKATEKPKVRVTPENASSVVGASAGVESQAKLAILNETSAGESEHVPKKVRYGDRMKNDTKREDIEAYPNAVDGTKVAALVSGNGAEKATKREDIEKMLLEKVMELLGKRQVETAAQEASERKAARLAKIRRLLRLPSSRKHATGVPEVLVSHPLQLQEEQMLFYSSEEFGLWELMSQLQGWSLPLGEAPVWDGGNARAAEEFAAVCGFSAAFGQLLFRHATILVFGEIFFKGVTALPPEHIAHMFGAFWDKEIASFDAAERFFRLARSASKDYIGKVVHL